MCITLIDDCPGPSQTCSDCEGLTFVQKQHCNTCRPWSVKYRKDAPFYCEGRRWLQRFHCWKCCAGKDCPDYEEVILTTFCPPCRRNRNQPAESSRTERLERKQAIRAIQNKIKGEKEPAPQVSPDVSPHIRTGRGRLSRAASQLLPGPSTPSPQVPYRLPRSRRADLDAWNLNASPSPKGLFKQEAGTPQDEKTLSTYESPYTASRARSKSPGPVTTRYPSPTLDSSVGYPYWPYCAVPQGIKREDEQQIKREK